MGEFKKVRIFLGCEPLRLVDDLGRLSLEELFGLFFPDIVPEVERRLLTNFLFISIGGRCLLLMGWMVIGLESW
ncbi:MAG: hypothetical protein ACUVXA_01540 [Candidatus Jordarchaeum sp.]|uniref:hypothetical protein n=1 Tax=Candidatus Jordarchaeum sp. TaxID=2823881 RepID=UPI00404A538A